MTAAANTLVIACGALGREIIALRTANQWSHMDVTCLPAELHNRPDSHQSWLYLLASRPGLPLLENGARVAPSLFRGHA